MDTNTKEGVMQLSNDGRVFQPIADGFVQDTVTRVYHTFLLWASCMKSVGSLKGQAGVPGTLAAVVQKSMRVSAEFIPPELLNGF